MARSNVRNLVLFVCLLVAVVYASDWYWKPLLKLAGPAPAQIQAPPVAASLSERKDQGPVVQYYDNGAVKAERQFRDGKLDGPYKLYHENGKLKLEGEYRNDQMHGIFKKYSPEGKLLSEEVYVDNSLTKRTVFEPGPGP
jgi:hypothetical protein